MYYVVFHFPSVLARCLMSATLSLDIFLYHVLKIVLLNLQP